MSQAAVSGRRAVPGVSQAWIALRNQKTLFGVVFVLGFTATATPVLLTPRDFHVLAEIPVTGFAASARTLPERLTSPDRVAAALSTLERSDSRPVVHATVTADGKLVRIEAQGNDPQRAGDLITAILRKELADDHQSRLAAAEGELAEARKQRVAAQAEVESAAGKLAAIEKENTVRGERNRATLAAHAEAMRRRNHELARNRAASGTRGQARTLVQALARRRYIGVRIDVLVDEIQGLRARLAATPETVSDGESPSTAYTQELKIRLDSLLTERDDLAASRGPSDPAVREVESRIRRMRQRLAEEASDARDENRRPNPERALVASRLQAREAELASINAERGPLLARITALEAAPAPPEPATPPPTPKHVAEAVLEPMLDVAQARRRLEKTNRQYQEAEAEVQRVAQRLRETQATKEVDLPSLQYPAPEPLALSRFLYPLGLSLFLGLMAVGIGEVRSRRLASSPVKLRRRRTLDDRSRELIEDVPAGPEPEPEPKPVAEAPAPEIAPTVSPSSVSAPEPGWRPSSGPPPILLRESLPPRETRPAPIEPLPIPDTSPVPAAEMTVHLPPPAQETLAATLLLNVAASEPVAIPDTTSVAAPEMTPSAPPFVPIPKGEGTQVLLPAESAPVAIPATVTATVPEMELLAPPAVPITRPEPVIAEAAASEPEAAIPQSAAGEVDALEPVAPQLLPVQTPETTHVALTYAMVPKLAEDAAAVDAIAPPRRAVGRVRIVRKRAATPLTLPEPAPQLAPEAPAPASVTDSPTTLVSRAHEAIPTEERSRASLIATEPVREWVELSAEDEVPDAVDTDPETEVGLADEAIFSGQPETLLDVPAPIPPDASPADQRTTPAAPRRAAAKPRTRPRPLRELATLTRNYNPLAAALEPSAAAADAVALQRIRGAIELARCRTLLVCGANRGDGASHTALLLAAHLSGRGWPVVLIDADFRHRSLHRSLRVPHLPGFSEFLMELADPREVLQETEYERLETISAGPLLADPAILLDPMRLDRAVRILRDLGALVIFDGGAALSEAQAELIAPFADGVLLVTRHGKGGGWTLKKANERLHAAQATVLGLVRNPHRS